MEMERIENRTTPNGLEKNLLNVKKYIRFQSRRKKITKKINHVAFTHCFTCVIVLKVDEFPSLVTIVPGRISDAASTGKSLLPILLESKIF